MEYYSLQIINLYKHNIVHKSKSKFKMNVTMLVAIVCMSLLLMGISTKFIAKDYFTTLSNTISIIFNNPVNPLYHDTGNIIFTGGFTTDKYNIEKDVEFVIPVFSSKTTVEQNHIKFEILDSIMIVASADGVVEEVGTNSEGQKFIKIKHTKSLSTIYTNIEIAGVLKGDEVKQGDEIATAKIGDTVSFAILKNGVPVSKLTVTQNKVQWQS